MTEDCYDLLIVDDEPLARQGLREAVARLAIDAVRLRGECPNGPTAIDAIRKDRPDILLLDIAMPVMDGFEMLERLEPEAVPPAVVFVTAYDEHAVRAFEAEAIGYVVKPVRDTQLRSAIERAMRRVREARLLTATLPAGDQTDAPGYLTRLVIPEQGRSFVVPVEDIDWIEGDTYYVKVHTRDRARLLRERMSRLETLLDPAVFYRCHRSAIVRLAAVRELRRQTPYSHAALLDSGVSVPVSRERVRALEALLGAS